MAFHAPVSQEAERIRNFNRIINLALVHIRLAEDDQRRSRLAHEQRFHGRQRDRLILGNHAALAIARRE